MEHLDDLDLAGMSWVIAGGESGLCARPMEADFPQPIRDRRRREDVLFFFEQWGATLPKSAGRRLDGLTRDGLPERRSDKIVVQSLP